jgi:hypothetical protein
MARNTSRRTHLIPFLSRSATITNVHRGCWRDGVGLSMVGEGVGGREIRNGPDGIDIYGAAKCLLGAFKEYPAHLARRDLSDC